MEKLSVKIKIANRYYPLTINHEEEEDIRQAAEVINDMITEFTKNYRVKDMQDLLAMVALKTASKRNSQEDVSDNDTDILEEIKASLAGINSDIKAYL